MTIMQPLKDQNLITPIQFDEPIEYENYELWHHWGRTTKFGAWMQGPDYTQWHGAYEVIKGLSTLHYDANELMHSATEIAPAGVIEVNNQSILPNPLQEMIPLLKRWRLPFNRDQAMLALAAVNVFFLGSGYLPGAQPERDPCPLRMDPHHFQPDRRCDSADRRLDRHAKQASRQPDRHHHLFLLHHCRDSRIVFSPAARFPSGRRRRDHDSQ